MRHTVNIDDDTGKRIKEIARQEEISISDFYVEAARKELKRRQRREAFAEINELIGSTKVNRDRAQEEIERLREDRY